MSRPSHATQQQEVDDALAALPSQRWRWLWTPDPRWLAAVNTTTLREVNAVRMFVVVTVLFLVLEVAVVGYALARCHFISGPLGSGETVATVRQLCEESIATARLFDFASSLFTGYVWMWAAAAGVAVGGMFLKRATDTEHVERKERAKKAPIIEQTVITKEHPAVAPMQQVNVGEDAIAAANGEVRAQGGDDSRTDDERDD